MCGINFIFLLCLDKWKKIRKEKKITSGVMWNIKGRSDLMIVGINFINFLISQFLGFHCSLPTFSMELHFEMKRGSNDSHHHHSHSHHLRDINFFLLCLQVSHLIIHNEIIKWQQYYCSKKYLISCIGHHFSILYPHPHT